MNRAGRILLGLCFALLLLLGAKTLVEGPEQVQAPIVPLRPYPVEAYLTATADPAGVQAQARVASPGSMLRRCMLGEDAQAMAPVFSPVCDRNGWPMGSQTYARTVYTACPLEDMPG